MEKDGFLVLEGVLIALRYEYFVENLECKHFLQDIMFFWYIFQINVNLILDGCVRVFESFGSIKELF